MTKKREVAFKIIIYNMKKNISQIFILFKTYLKFDENYNFFYNIWLKIIIFSIIFKSKE